MDPLPSALLWGRKGKVRLPFALCQNVLDTTRLFQLRFSARKWRIGRVSVRSHQHTAMSNHGDQETLNHQGSAALPPLMATTGSLSGGASVDLGEGIR